VSTAENAEVARLHGEDQIRAVAFRPGGQDVAVAGLGKAIELWRIDAGGSDVAHIAAGPATRARAFSADESRLTTIDRAGDRLAATHWPVDAGSTPAHLDAGPDSRLAVISADGRFIGVAEWPDRAT